MHRHGLAVLVNCSYAICVSVSGQSDNGSCFNHPLLQWRKVLIDRFWVHASEQRITVRTNCFNAKTTALKKTFDPVARCSMHWINNHSARRPTNLFEIDV